MKDLSKAVDELLSSAALATGHEVEPGAPKLQLCWTTPDKFNPDIVYVHRFISLNWKNTFQSVDQSLQRNRDRFPDIYAKI